MTIKIGEKYVYGKELVTAITEQDPRGRVCIKNEEGEVRVVRVDKLKLTSDKAVKCWWHENTFHITITGVLGGTLERVSIPRDMIPQILKEMQAE